MGVETFLAVGDVTGRIDCIIGIAISICQVKTRNAPCTVGKGGTRPTIHGTILTDSSILILEPILSTLGNTIGSQHATHIFPVEVVPTHTRLALVLVNTVETELLTVGAGVIQTTEIFQLGTVG